MTGHYSNRAFFTTARPPEVERPPPAAAAGAASGAAATSSSAGSTVEALRYFADTCGTPAMSVVFSTFAAALASFTAAAAASLLQLLASLPLTVRDALLVPREISLALILSFSRSLLVNLDLQDVGVRHDL